MLKNRISMKIFETGKVYSFIVSQPRHCFRNVHRCQSTSAEPASLEQAKPFKSIPGLSSLPIIGPLHNFLPVIGEIGPRANLFEVFSVLHKKYGGLVKMDGILARADAVILFEPEHFNQVYRSEESSPSRPGFETMVYFRESYGKFAENKIYGLITAEGAKWRDIRTKVNPALLKPKLIKLYSPALNEISKEMTAKLIKLSNDGDYLNNNFDWEILKWSLESIALVGLGARLGCLEDNLPNDHPGQQLIRCSKEIFELTFKLELTPNPWKYIATPSFKKLMNIYELQWNISEKYIGEARKKIKERAYEVPEEEKSIIEKLLAIDEKVAVMMANEMLFAGIDTVAFVTTSLIYYLAVNPKVQDTLREEILADDTNNRYLRACIKEALRFWHVVPANLRRTTRDHVVAGYHIPKGVDVIAPNEYLSRMDKYYPRANEFIPERWLVPKTDPLYHGNAHPMVTLPFGFGVRSCIGRRVAELEIETLVKNLIKEATVSWEGPPLKVVSRLVNSFAKPYAFKFEVIK